MKPFECSENGVDRLGLFRIGKYPVFRRNVLWPVVILLEALRDCRHIPTGSEYAALVDTHIPSVCFIIEVVLNVLRYVDGPKLVGVQTAQPFIIGIFFLFSALSDSGNYMELLCKEKFSVSL